MNNKIIFTIVAKNYLHFAITLYKSAKINGGKSEFRIYVADGLNNEIIDLARTNDLPIFDALKGVDSNSFLKMAFYYEVTEYCTSIKPFIIRQLFNEGYDYVTYVDPDIYIYANLDIPVYKILENYDIFLTPHICEPISDELRPNESDHLISGTYNLGFISVNKSENSKAFVDWWCKKCEFECFNDPTTGLFVDQKWINLVPGLFSGVYISRNFGLNIAYWNLHERFIDRNGIVNSSYPLIFIHYSGVDINNIENISKYKNRYRLSDRQDLDEYFRSYATEVRSNIHSSFEVKYSFASYSDGRSISLLARRVFFWNKDRLDSPFSSSDAEAIFLSILATYNIKESVGVTSKPKTDEINRKARVINLLLRQALRFFGPNRYAQLARYFGFLSSLNNHKFIERDVDVV